MVPRLLLYCRAPCWPKRFPETWWSKAARDLPSQYAAVRLQLAGPAWATREEVQLWRKVKSPAVHRLHTTGAVASRTDQLGGPSQNSHHICSIPAAQQLVSAGGQLGGTNLPPTCFLGAGCSPFLPLPRSCQLLSPSPFQGGSVPLLISGETFSSSCCGGIKLSPCQCLLPQQECLRGGRPLSNKPKPNPQEKHACPEHTATRTPPRAPSTRVGSRTPMRYCRNPFFLLVLNLGPTWDS